MQRNVPSCRLLRVTVGASVLLGCALARADAQSLADALALAYEHNPQLLSERAQLRAIDEQVPQALANWRPSVQVSASKGYGHEDVSGGTPFQNSFFLGQLPSSSYSVSITQPLFRGFRTVAQTRQAYDTVAAERAHLASVEQSVLLQAITDYVDVARDERTLSLAAENETALEKRLVAVRGRFAGGALTRLDLAQTEADRDAAQAQRQLAQASLDESRARFARDIGAVPEHLNYPSVAVKLSDDRERVVEAAELCHPDVIAADYKARAADEAVTVAQGQALPTIDVQGSYAHQNDASFKGSQNDVEAAQIRLSWSIYQGGAIESLSRQAEQTAEQRHSELDLARDKAGGDAAGAWSRLAAQRAAIASFKAQADADAIALTGTEIQRQAGERTVLDVLNAERALLQARGDLNRAQHDEIIAEYSFAAALGTLNARNLRLPVALYDPAANFSAVRDAWFGFGTAQ